MEPWRELVKLLYDERIDDVRPRLRAKINLVPVPATRSVWWEELNEKYFGKSQ